VLFTGVPFTDIPEIQFNRENINIVYNRLTLCVLMSLAMLHDITNNRACRSRRRK